VKKIQDIESKYTFYLTLNNPDHGSIFFIHPLSDQHKFEVMGNCGRLLCFRQKEWLHYGNPLRTEGKFALLSNIYYKYQKDLDNIELPTKNCGLCNNSVKIRILKCGHPFVHCGCPPYSRYAKTKECYFCKAPVDIPQDILLGQVDAVNDIWKDGTNGEF